MGKVKVYFYVLALTLLFAGAAGAQPNAKMYGLVLERNVGPVPDSLTDGSSTRLARSLQETFLYAIDPDTGQATRIGDTGYPECTGMDFHPVTGVLYAVCFNPFELQAGTSTKALAQPGDFYLVTIDLKTGEATEIGDTGLAPTGGNNNIITDLSFRSDGTLFANVNTDGDILLGTIDIRTGAFTPLGLAGVDALSGGLAFSAMDVLYSADLSNASPVVLLNMRDQAVGGTNFIANLNLSLNVNQIPIVTSMDLNPADGQIYAYLYDQGMVVPKSSSDTSTQRALEAPQIATIDTKTGDVEFRASTIELVSAIAFVPIRNLNIPTLSEWGLIILAACMLMGSLAVLRRRAGRGTV